MFAKTSGPLLCLCTTCAAALVACGVWFWRGRNQKEAKAPASPLDAATGALVEYRPPQLHSVEEEFVDNRALNAPHQSLLFEFQDCWCQVDSWLKNGRAGAAVEVHGALTAFFVDTSTSQVFVSRSSGAAVRPTDGEGILLLMPDSVFAWASIEDFHHRLLVAAATQLPMFQFDSAVAAFFAEYHVHFPASDLPPYWLVGLPALF